MNTNMTLCPEWAEQDAVLIVWPNAEMDWAYILDKVERTYIEIAQTILQYEALIVLCQERSHVEQLLGTQLPHPLIIIDGFAANDTWARDTTPLAMTNDLGERSVIDFSFNGWGLKFASNHDNTIGRRLYHEVSLFAPEVSYCNALHLVCEGGALESDGAGTIMTTASVLGESNRNPQSQDMATLAGMHQEALNAKQIFVSHIPPMPGDDTDGHIDTLARFVDSHTIVYNDLPGFADELASFTTADRTKYKLVPLPVPTQTYDDEGTPLPATYANFLIINGAVLVPTYGQPETDKAAIAVLTELFSDRHVIGIDCQALVQQHGSLHCITMQYPRGFINRQLLNSK